MKNIIFWTMTLCSLIDMYHTFGGIYVGGPKKNEFSLKKKIYLHFTQKIHNALQNTCHWRQYTCPIFFPTV